MPTMPSSLALLGYLGLLQQAYNLPEQSHDSRFTEYVLPTSTRNYKRNIGVQVKTLIGKASPCHLQWSASRTYHPSLLLAHSLASAFVPTHLGKISGEKRKALPCGQQIRHIKDQRSKFAQLLIGTQPSEHKEGFGHRGVVNMMFGALRATDTNLRTVIKSKECAQQFKLQEAVEKCGMVISKTPIDTLGNSTNILGQILKIAKRDRANYNEQMGNINESISEFREILYHSPSETKSKIALAWTLHNSVEESLESLETLASALEDPPQAPSPIESRVPGEAVAVPVLRWLAAKEAAVIAASLGEHERAREYFDMCSNIDERNEMEQGVGDVQLQLFDMVNALCSGDTERAAKKKDDLMRGFGTGPSIVSSWAYIRSTPVGLAPKPSFFYGQKRMLEFAMDAASLPAGLILEFGVWHGKSLRWIASRFPDAQVHGFDTFTGLPEAWGTIPEGGYSAQGALPSDLPQNVQLHKGFFNETLPGFLDAHDGPIRFMHVDCDLYAGTKDIFDQVSSRIVKGTIIIFNEMFFISYWQQTEFKAFKEAVAKNNWTFEYLAIGGYGQESVIRIT